MRKIITLITLLIIVWSCEQKTLVAVTEQTFHYNHEIFEENKLAPRATFFATESNDIQLKKTQNDF